MTYYLLKVWHKFRCDGREKKNTSVKIQKTLSLPKAVVASADESAEKLYLFMEKTRWWQLLKYLFLLLQKTDLTVVPLSVFKTQLCFGYMKNKSSADNVCPSAQKAFVFSTGYMFCDLLSVRSKYSSGPDTQT